MMVIICYTFQVGGSIRLKKVTMINGRLVYPSVAGENIAWPTIKSVER